VLDFDGFSVATNGQPSSALEDACFFTYDAGDHYYPFQPSLPATLPLASCSASLTSGGHPFFPVNVVVFCFVISPALDESKEVRSFFVLFPRFSPVRF